MPNIVPHQNAIISVAFLAKTLNVDIGKSFPIFKTDIDGKRTISFTLPLVMRNGNNETRAIVEYSDAVISDVELSSYYTLYCGLPLDPASIKDTRLFAEDSGFMEIIL